MFRHAISALAVRGLAGAWPCLCGRAEEKKATLAQQALARLFLKSPPHGHGGALRRGEGCQMHVDYASKLVSFS